MTEEQRTTLVEAALEARALAYAPYSHFQVGAALLTANGSIIRGCNVENASYGLTVCAERVAIGVAIAAGERQFTAIAVASAGAATPCGACRQVLAEFAQELPILLIDANDGRLVQTTSLENLLPQRFTPH